MNRTSKRAPQKIAMKRQSERANGFARGHRIGVAKGEGLANAMITITTNTLQTQKSFPQEWMETREVFSPIQNRCGVDASQSGSIIAVRQRVEEVVS